MAFLIDSNVHSLSHHSTGLGLLLFRAYVMIDMMAVVYQPLIYNVQYCSISKNGVIYSM